MAPRRTPVLLLAYNRPDKFRSLVDSLRSSAPRLVYVVVDGPRPGNDDDRRRVEEVRAAVDGIDWGADVRTRFRPTNVGLRASVADAVTWVVGENDEVIVVEDDVVAGPHLLAYLEHMLEVHRGDHEVFHISGYNLVPPTGLSTPPTGSRRSVYPESYVWATWSRAWDQYSDQPAWIARAPLGALRRVTASVWAALRWRQNFADARAGRISTWAYRWIASIWERGGVTVCPNVNLATYGGQVGGTHTRLKQRWAEQPLYDGPLEPLLTSAGPLDPRAEAWVNRVVFRGTPLGVVRGVAISAVLELRRRLRRAAG